MVVDIGRWRDERRRRVVLLRREAMTAQMFVDDHVLMLRDGSAAVILVCILGMMIEGGWYKLKDHNRCRQNPAGLPTEAFLHPASVHPILLRTGQERSSNLRPSDWSFVSSPEPVVPFFNHDVPIHPRLSNFTWRTLLSLSPLTHTLYRPGSILVQHPQIFITGETRYPANPSAF